MKEDIQWERNPNATELIRTTGTVTKMISTLLDKEEINCPYRNTEIVVSTPSDILAFIISMSYITKDEASSYLCTEIGISIEKNRQYIDDALERFNENIEKFDILYENYYQDGMLH